MPLPLRRCCRGRIPDPHWVIIRVSHNTPRVSVPRHTCQTPAAAVALLSQARPPPESSTIAQSLRQYRTSLERVCAWPFCHTHSHPFTPSPHRCGVGACGTEGSCSAHRPLGEREPTAVATPPLPGRTPPPSFLIH